jgi:hypothetical protein
MTIVKDIQDELIAVYEGITLPNGLGIPSGFRHEPIGSFGSDDLPSVVVNRGILITRIPLSADRNQVVREYITDLYTYTYEDSDPVNATNRDNTSDTIGAIENTFAIYQLATTGVIFHDFSADTGDVELFARDEDTNYLGVRFRHQITYIQEI